MKIPFSHSHRIINSGFFVKSEHRIGIVQNILSSKTIGGRRYVDVVEVSFLDDLLGGKVKVETCPCILTFPTKIDDLGAWFRPGFYNTHAGVFLASRNYGYRRYTLGIRKNDRGLSFERGGVFHDDTLSKLASLPRHALDCYMSQYALNDIMEYGLQDIYEPIALSPSVCLMPLRYLLHRDVSGNVAEEIQRDTGFPMRVWGAVVDEHMNVLHVLQHGDNYNNVMDVIGEDRMRYRTYEEMSHDA